MLHLRAPGQLWIRFWIVGCEKPKKSAPDGTMGVADLELKHEDTGELTPCGMPSRLRKVVVVRYLEEAVTFRRLA